MEQYNKNNIKIEIFNKGDRKMTKNKYYFLNKFFNSIPNVLIIEKIHSESTPNKLTGISIIHDFKVKQKIYQLVLDYLSLLEDTDNIRYVSNKKYYIINNLIFQEIG